MNLKAVLGVALGVATLGLVSGRRGPAAPPAKGVKPTPKPTPKPPAKATPKPADPAPKQDLPPAAGDLEVNWGETPVVFRPLFVLMEEILQAPGAARFFAVVAFAESRFVVDAHNEDPGEVKASRRAYDQAHDKYPPLSYAMQAREFGSGGLFGQLGPYFLWTGAAELDAEAPLLGVPPVAMFKPRLAAYGAVVNLHRLLTLYRVDDLLDARVGWASVDLLGAHRGSADYLAVRQRFRDKASQVGIDLAQLPPKLQPGKWMGAKQAYLALTG